MILIYYLCNNHLRLDHHDPRSTDDKIPHHKHVPQRCLSKMTHSG